jgi:hypothetical protein
LKKGIAAKVDLQSLPWHPIWIDELLRKLVAAGLLETPRSLWSSRSRCEAIHFMADLSNKEALQQCS